MAHLWVRCSVRTRVGLRFSARGMAFRSGRSYLVARRASAMARQEETFKLTQEGRFATRRKIVPDA